MLKEYGENSGLIYYTRLHYYAAKQGCRLFNLSSDPLSRLPYQQTTPERIDNVTEIEI